MLRGMHLQMAQRKDRLLRENNNIPARGLERIHGCQSPWEPTSY